MSSVVLSFAINSIDHQTVTEDDIERDHVISANMIRELEALSDCKLVSEKKKTMKHNSRQNAQRKVWRKKEAPNNVMMKRNKNKCKTSKAMPFPPSIFGTASTERNEVRESAIPGPGAYTEDLTSIRLTSKSPKYKSKAMKSAATSTTFGISKKVISTECEQTDNLGPGCYESPKLKMNGLGAIWAKAPRPVVDAVDVDEEMKKSVGAQRGDLDLDPSSGGSPLFTEKDLRDSQFDWKWYRTQNHEMVMHQNKASKSPLQLRSTIISNKFVPIAQSPTHNKSNHHFGASPRFKDINTDPMNLSSFRGSGNRPTSVKQILSPLK